VRIHRAEGQDWAVLLHGFTRRGRDLDVLAKQLQQRGISSIAPDLGSLNWFRSTNNPRYLDRVASDISPIITGPCVLIGHSAGAAAAGHLATKLQRVRGIVFVDGNESPTHLLANAWPHIAHLPMVAICAPPSRCNRGGQFASWAQQRGIPGCVVPGMGHGDIEGSARAIYRVVCGSAGTPQTRVLTVQLVADTAQRMLTGGEQGVFPAECHPW
jgi:pimeloyl-ACP methyl ester carboxylesterase